MKTGDKVKCIDNSGCEGCLKKGAVYTVERISDDYAYVEDSRGKLEAFNFSRFETAEEIMFCVDDSEVPPNIALEYGRAYVTTKAWPGVLNVKLGEGRWQYYKDSRFSKDNPVTFGHKEEKIMEPTGRLRLRPGDRSELILQVEERFLKTRYSVTLAGAINSEWITLWRDAKVEDISINV